MCLYEEECFRVCVFVRKKASNTEKYSLYMTIIYACVMQCIDQVLRLHVNTYRPRSHSMFMTRLSDDTTKNNPLTDSQAFTNSRVRLDILACNAIALHALPQHI